MIVDGIHEAISIATASTFVVGIVSAFVAGLVVLVLLPAGKIGVQEGYVAAVAMPPRAAELESSD